MKRLLHGAFAAVAALWCLFPFLWQWLTSLKDPARVAVLPPALPQDVSLASYAAVLRQELFLKVVVNSLAVSLGATLLALTVGTLGAFGVSRLMATGKNAVLLALLVVFMIPQVAVVTPLFKLLTALHLKDTWTGLIVVYALFTVPLVVWILVPVFDAIPESLYRAARVDGCPPWRIFCRVYLPLARPGLVSAGLLALIFCWNEFLFALTFTTTFGARTIPVGISLFAGQYDFPWGEITAASTLVTLPILLIVALAQKHLVRGLGGGLKG